MLKVKVPEVILDEWSAVASRASAVASRASAMASRASEAASRASEAASRATAVAATATVMSATAFGGGFGLFEMDSKSTGMGGHVTARPFNASAVYYNPGSMQSLTGTCVTVGGTFLHPPTSIKVDGRHCRRQDPGWFAFPTAYVTQELPWGFHVGAGMFADFGLGSHYHQSWPLAHDSGNTVFEGYTFQAVASYDITDRWSFGIGPRLTYVNFETDMRRDFGAFPDMWVNTPMGPYNAAGQVRRFGRNKLRIRADNEDHLGLGLAAGTSYRVTDDFAVGAMFRSRIKTKLDGHATWTGDAGYHCNKAGDDLTLPAQVQIGFNWDRSFGFEDLHFGASGSWLEWSTMSCVTFGVYNPTSQKEEGQDIDFRWRNTYRGGFGFAYDLTPNWQVLAGYVYDWDPTRERAGLAHTMLPPGDRHIPSFGLSWTSDDGRWELSASYACIILESRTYPVKDEWHAYNGVVHQVHNHNAYVQCVTFGVTYRF